MEKIDTNSTMAKLLGDLESAKRKRREAEEEMEEISSILRSLSGDPPDLSLLTRRLQRSEERLAGDMFELIRPALRANKTGATAQDITNFVLMTLARACFERSALVTSTTLRLMVKSGEVKQFTNEQGEETFRLRASRADSKKQRKPQSARKRSKRYGGYRGLAARRSRRVKNY